MYSPNSCKLVLFVCIYIYRYTRYLDCVFHKIMTYSYINNDTGVTYRAKWSLLNFTSLFQ